MRALLQNQKENNSLKTPKLLGAPFELKSQKVDFSPQPAKSYKTMNNLAKRVD